MFFELSSENTQHVHAHARTLAGTHVHTQTEKNMIHKLTTINIISKTISFIHQYSSVT